MTKQVPEVPRAGMLASGFFTVALSFWAPAAFFLARNYSHSTLRGNLLSFLAAGAAGAAAAVICKIVVAGAGLLARGLGRGGAAAASGPLRSRLSFRLAAISLAIVLLSPFFSFTAVPGPGSPLLVLLCAAGTYYVCSKIGFKIINVFLAVFLAISIVNAAMAEVNDRRERIDLPPNPALPPTFAMKTKPNIYLFFLESYQSRDVIKKYYGFDAPDLFAKMAERDFVVYDRYVSNYTGTLEAALALFSMRHHYNKLSWNLLDVKRSYFTLLANNNFFRILNRNGYRINLFDYSDSYVFRLRSDYVDYTHFPQDGDLADTVKKFLLMLNPRFGAVVSTEGGRDAVEPGKSNLAVVDVIDRDYPRRFDLRGAPNFFYIHFGAAHGPMFGFKPTGKEGWVESYTNFFLDAAGHVVRLVDLIQANDPDAMIIMVGDHGAYLHGRDGGLVEMPAVLDGKEDVNAFYRSRGVEPVDVGRNLVSVLCAIRWPKGVQAPRDLPPKGLSHVNLLPYALFRLNGLEYDEDDFDDNVSVNSVHKGSRYMVMARDGEALADWELSELIGERLVKVEP